MRRRLSSLAGVAALRSLNVHPQRVPLFHAASALGEAAPGAGVLGSVHATLRDFPGFVFEPARRCTRDELLTVHSAAYVDRVLAATDEQVELSRRAVGAALQALDSIKQGQHMIAGTLTGGYHHAARDCEGPGCVFNDLAVAAVVAVQQYSVQRVLICDLDMQQGDGTASIFKDDERVITFSMHAAHAHATRNHSDYDVDYEENTPDAAYLDLLKSFLGRLLDSAMPQLIIYQAGVSHLVRGELQLTRRGLQERNLLVYQAALQRQVPVLITCGASNDGALDEPRVRALVTEAHCDVYRGAYQSIITHNHRQFFF